MLSEEVKKVVNIFEKADGGCSYCVTDLLNSFVESFPEYSKYVQSKLIKYKKELGKTNWRLIQDAKK